jgi:hypothetical protein
MGPSVSNGVTRSVCQTVHFRCRSSRSEVTAPVSPPADDDAGLLTPEEQFDELVRELLATQPTDVELAIESILRAVQDATAEVEYKDRTAKWSVRRDARCLDALHPAPKLTSSDDISPSCQERLKLAGCERSCHRIIWNWTAAIHFSQASARKLTSHNLMMRSA